MTLLLALLLACGPKAAPPVSPVNPSAALAPETLPTPYTAEQIRDAMPVGTVIRLKMEVSGQPLTEQRWTVTAADAEGCTIHSEVLDAGTGALLVDEGSDASRWDELRDHAAFPAAHTTQAEGEITVPAGTFATRIYHVSAPDAPSRHFWFSPDLPGPPVQMTVLAPDGAELMRMSLIERTRP